MAAPICASPNATMGSVAARDSDACPRNQPLLPCPRVIAPAS